MAGLGTSCISPRLIKSTKVLVILFLSLVIFFTNLYFLNIIPTTKKTSKNEILIQLSARHFTTTGVIKRKNSTIPATPSKKVEDIPTLGLFANMDTSCSQRIREMDGGTLLFGYVSIRPKLGRAKVLEVHLEHPEEEDEFFSLKKGFFTLYCDSDTEEAKGKLSVAENNEWLTAWAISVEIKHPSPSLHLRKPSFQAGQYLAIERKEYANVYWTIMDLFDIFITARRMGIEPEKLNIILIDAHPTSPLDPFWSVLFQRLIKLTDRIFTESADVVFENLVWRYPRDNSPLLDRDLKSLEYIQPFRTFVLNRFNIPWEARKRNCSQHKLNVLVVFRRDYKNHPRNLNGIIDRKIANENDVLKELETKFSSKVNIITAQLDSLPLKRQLELISSADVFFGMHGAAHAFPIFMAPGGAVIEMFPLDTDNWHMRKISTLSGHYHVMWENRNPKAYNERTKSMTVRAGISSMLLKKAYKKVCARS